MVQRQTLAAIISCVMIVTTSGYRLHLQPDISAFFDDPDVFDDPMDDSLVLFYI